MIPAVSPVTIKVVHDAVEAKQVWEELTPHLSLYDEWDFRQCYQRYFKDEFYFYTAYEEGRPVALLPLVYSKASQQLEFIGGIFMYDNGVFVQTGKESAIPLLYGAVNQSADLRYIIGSDPFTMTLPIDEYKYGYDLQGVSSLEDFLLKKFNSKVRNNLKRKMKTIEAENVQWIENNYEDVELLIKFNIEQFKESSSFNKPHRPDIYRDLLRLTHQKQLLTCVINGKKEAVSLAFVYKDRYIYLNLGKNNETYPQLGGYVNLKNIERAIALGCKEFDAGMVDLGWKKDWNMSPLPAHTFKR